MADARKNPKYDIRVDAQCRYLPDQSDPAQGVYRFAYTITIRNTGTVASQLISRHWLIQDANGRLQEVKGLGVVGRQPLIQPGQSFEYSSACQLDTPQGAMHGQYFFVAEDGNRFEAPIEEFALVGPRTLH
jgi:ApaG protein